MHFYFNDMFGNYIYDSVVNDTVEVSESFYRALKSGQLDFDKSEIKTEYEKLSELGFFPERKHPIQYPMFNYMKSMFNRIVSKMTIQVTQACNFRCKYCVYTDNNGMERVHSSKVMTWEMMKKTLDFLHANSIDSKMITIGFYGGEPLLNYKLIHDAIEYSEKIFEGKPLVFAITTNASLLSTEILSFLEKRDVALTISIDGPKRVNDRNRVFAGKTDSTFDVVKEKIKIIVNKYRGLLKYLSINMVLDPCVPYSDYQKIYDEIPELSEIKVRASVVSDDGLSEKHSYCQKFLEESEYARFIYRISTQSKCIDNSTLNERNILAESFGQGISQIKRMIGNNIYNFAPSGPCVPAYNKIFVDVDGRFFPCEKVSEVMDDLCIGDVETGIEVSKLVNLVKIATITEEECRNCWCFNMCGSCVKYCVDAGGISKKARLSFCKKNCQTATDMLYQYNSMKRHNELEI